MLYSPIHSSCIFPPSFFTFVIIFQFFPCHFSAASPLYLYYFFSFFILLFILPCVLFSLYSQSYQHFYFSFSSFTLPFFPFTLILFLHSILQSLIFSPLLLLLHLPIILHSFTQPSFCNFSSFFFTLAFILQPSLYT